MIIKKRFSTLSSVFLLSTLLSTTIAIAQQWHTVKHPTSGPTEIHGSYANGCFSGGITIPIKGTGYEQVRPSRNRHYGAPSIQKFVESLDLFGQQKQRVIILGDIAQPRGGPANFGHASHQTGLDIDIWLEDRNTHLEGNLREKLNTPSVVNPGTGTINQHWQPFYRELLYHAATYPETERIFVNPVIKAQLCKIETDKAWLEKLRPWYGHDSHFHVRLKCPSGSTGCIAQAPIPKGSGCDNNLQNWVNDQIKWTNTPPKKSSTSPTPKPKKVLPIECQAILQQR